ncbi:MAG: hypothetical protein A3I05_00950 [Deltaproteobacteria bacterium RIFCSPLOWO2_02_FULL_44_10]|nr:MAG: hypothetical protein A3C46_02010 [Deltaproteobacteria bacterium RIFCSPHIGHO2_02_FULL_44_16]OGQ45846.1 MAG: hypothetical protein A3I05_00950 [Deltaproteobacteria bacterium RIFCSPLOWO2_02_FULL_44_10]
MERLLGAHVSTAGGVSQSFLIADTLQLRAMQIFAKNNNQWMSKPLAVKEIDTFHARRAASGLQSIFSHAGYLINLASPDEEISSKSFASMLQELTRAEELQLAFVVLHPGAHMGKGEAQGLKVVSEMANRLFDHTRDSSVKIAFEITAGQGTCLGYRFEHLAEILHGVENKERAVVCFDTAHAFAAGYDFRTISGYEQMWKHFNETIGLSKLCAIHLNDSKKDVGTRVDRHDHIGKGFIGLEGFRHLMNDGRFLALPMVLETPKEGDPEKYDAENLAKLRELIR